MMRAAVFLVLCISASFGDIDFHTKTRNFSVELLYNTLQDIDTDVVISPYIIWSLLIGMVHETLGSTRDQLYKVLFLTAEKREEVVEWYRSLRASMILNEGVLITSMRFIFYDENLLLQPDSIKRLEDDFHFLSQRVNFEESQFAADLALDTLKAYNIPTRNMIRVEDFEDSTMIMCNYLAFKAKWENPFNVSKTEVVYTRNEDGVGKTNVMYTKGRFRFSDFPFLKVSVMELPYQGDGKYCMLLIRPYGGYNIKQVYRKLRKVPLKDVLEKLQREEIALQEIEVKLPKITINSHVILNQALFNMGLFDVFDRNSANFDHFSKEKIFISEISNRVTIIIDEFETVVHSSTPSYEFKSQDLPKARAEEKEPFIYFIMEKSSATILFGGVYSKIDLY